MYKLNKKSLFRTFLFSKFNFFNLFRYCKEFLLFNKFCKKNKIDINLFPILNDYNPNHEIDYHYTYHPAWALKVLLSYKTKIHIDLASKLDFSLSVASFMPVEYHDYRIVNIKFNNFNSIFTDISNLPFKDATIDSISCMHVLEHIGLGRYGDPISFSADVTAANEIVRVISREGHFIFVTPLSSSFRIEFNAHRVYTYDNIVNNLFKDLDLVEFSLITDKGDFIENCNPEILNNQYYACGCFHFIKK